MLLNVKGVLMANDLALPSMAFYIDPILLVTLLKGLSINS